MLSTVFFFILLLLFLFIDEFEHILFCFLTFRINYELNNNN